MVIQVTFQHSANAGSADLHGVERGRGRLQGAAMKSVSNVREPSRYRFASVTVAPCIFDLHNSRRISVLEYYILTLFRTV
jgi:hypothetical protein